MVQQGRRPKTDDGFVKSPRPSKIPSNGERHSIDLPFEGTVGYTGFEVTKVSKVS